MLLLLFLLGEASAKRVSTAAAGPVVIEPSGKWCVRNKVQSEPKLISTRHGDDGPWSSFLIHVGSPGQDVNVLPDPYRGALVVVDPEGCPSDPRLADCVRNRGGTYKRGDSDTWNRSSRHAWNPSELHPPSAWTSWTSSNKTSQSDPLAQHPEGTSSTNKVGIDRVRGEADGRPWMVPEQGILSTSDLNPFVGIFGLATNAGHKARAMSPTSLFDNIRHQANQQSISWSYTAGRANEIPGSLVLGGYDVSRFNQSTTVTTVVRGVNWNLMTGLDGIIDQRSRSTSKITQSAPAGRPGLFQTISRTAI